MLPLESYTIHDTSARNLMNHELDACIDVYIVVLYSIGSIIFNCTCFVCSIHNLAWLSNQRDISVQGALISTVICMEASDLSW